MLLEETGKSPWPAVQKTNIPVHEFHYARLENLAADNNFSHRVLRGTGIDGLHDGLIINNLLAGFAHHRNTAANPWVNRFLTFVRKTTHP
jgi:cobyrinic acid a,c-diamide synthase